jgi:hypothetical protein
MIAACRIALSLLMTSVFLPNVASPPPIQGCDPRAPIALGADRRAAVARGGGGPAAGDDRWADLAASAPGGFAGAYLESAGGTATAAKPRRLVVRLVRPEQRDSALRALLPTIRELRGPEIDRGGVVVAPARWDFAQLLEWRRFLEPHAHAVAKVVSTDIDESHNRISYAVKTSADRGALIEHLGTLGIPCGLVDVRVASASR